MTGRLAPLALLALLGAQLASAERLVLYRLDRVGETAVLVPRLARLRAGPGIVERVTALFRRLRSGKRAAYGSASLDLSPERLAELERNRIVTVRLDPDRPRSREEVLGEVVLTLGELGVAVRAGDPPRIVTREDLAAPAYVLVLPFWLGLPPAPFPSALVRLPDGEVASVRALEKRLRAGDGRLRDAVLALLSHKDPERRVRAVRALGHLPGDVARSRLLGLLRDADTTVRVAAVDGLSRHPQPDVLAALTRLLAEDREEDVRATAARALMQSGDKASALAGIAYLLKSPDPARKVALLRKLRGARLEGMTDSLLPLLEDRSPRVRIAALEAMSGSGDRRLLAAVESLLDRDSDPEVRSLAARLLQRSGEPRFMARGLAADLGGTDEDRAVSAAEQLGDLKEEGRLPLERALLRGARRVRRAAARALGRLGDPRSLPALARAAADGLKEAELTAAAILARQPGAEIAKLVGSPDALLRRLAIVAAASAGGQEVQAAVAAAARDRDRDVRLAAARALGKLGGAGAGAALAALVQDEDDRVRKAAADSLGALGDPAGRPALLALAKYGNIEVRRAVFRALARLRGTPERESIPAMLEALYDEDAAVREHALLALGQADRKDRRILPVIILQLKDSAVGVRRAAVWALGRLGNVKVISNLEDALGDGAAEVRLAAVEALERLGGPTAAAVLEKHARVEKDRSLAARAREAAAKAREQQP